MDLKEMKAKHPIPYKLEAKPESDKTVVYLYGDIVDETPVDWWTGEPVPGDFITPKGVRDVFDGIAGDDIEIHINSYGGSVFASFAIKNYLAGLGKNITIVVDGIAASGASVIAMAGTKVKMYANSIMMIHNAITLLWGYYSADEMEKQVEVMRTIDKAVATNYLSKFKGDKAELEAMLAKDTWLTAEEAVAVGLADGIVEKTKKEPETVQNKFNKSDEMIAAFVNAAFFNLKN